MDVMIRNNFAENLFFISGNIKKIEERRKIVDIVAWALGKLKPCSSKLYGRARSIEYFNISTSIMLSGAEIIRI